MDEKKPESLSGNVVSGKQYTQPGTDASGEEKNTPENVEKLRKKLDSFKKAVLKKYSFTKSLGLLPGKAFAMFEEEEVAPELQKEVRDMKPMHLVMIIPEDEFKNVNKIRAEVIKLAKDSGEKLWVHIKSEVDLWNYGLDSKFQFVDAISASMPLHDDGFLGALRVANIHKSLVLGRFDRYIASYCIGGSLVRGTADATSDVDVFVVIDDTDVKRMSRIELLERLRGIIYDYIKEATALAGVKNRLEPQIYLLTDFWSGVKDANPVFFTFIRDGIPFYDRGTFLPWKRLLKMGKIKPSPEAIDQYMKEGEKTNDFVKRRLIDTMVDIYYGVVTPTQALMMLAGQAPPVPKTIVAEVKDILVDKEKVMTLKDLKTLEKAVKYFKDHEHGKLKGISGKEIDEFKKEAEGYQQNIKDMRGKLEVKMQENLVGKIHGEMEKMLKTLFGTKSQDALIKDLDTEIIKKGKLKPRMLEIAKSVLKIRQKVKNKKLTQTEMQRISGDANDLISSLVEYSQRKELVSSQKGIVQVVYAGNRKGEIVMTDSGVFFVGEKGIGKVSGKKMIDSDKKELEIAVRKTRDFLQTRVTSDVLGVLKSELGEFELVF
jgi:predicted nucleotidyltransferase